MELNTINATQLHDTNTEEILGTVYIASKSPNDSDDVLWEAWESFNKLEEYEGDTKSIEEFIVWFNENYASKIAGVSIDFIQL